MKSVFMNKLGNACSGAHGRTGSGRRTQMAGGDCTAPLSFGCTCGTLRGYLASQGVRSGTHVDCFCADCRANELYHGMPDPAPGPVDLFHMAPDGIRIEAGAAHLAAIRLSPKGMLRWYAGCCGTPIANTFAGPALPFVGLRTAVLERPERLGPLRGHGFVPHPDGRTRHAGSIAVVGGLLRRALVARLTGRWRFTPFFDAAGAPAGPVRVLDESERASLYRPEAGHGTAQAPK
mgnify:CR=1 FL=1